MAFKWLRPGRQIPPAPPRPVLPAPPCWVLGCTEGEAWARAAVIVPGLPDDARVCETHEHALEFNIRHPGLAGLDVSARSLDGSADLGWRIGGFLLVRPPALPEASPEPPRQRPDLP